MSNFDQISLMAKAQGNTVILDKVEPGMPGFYVPIPKMTISQLITGGSNSVHPAFIVNGVEKDVIFIGKYQSIMYNGKCYSLPMEKPGNNATFDTFLTRSREKGAGHHLMTNAEWALIALICKKQGFLPKGNNNYGKDHAESMYYGIPGTYNDDGTIRHILTGSGPDTYYHNGNRSGIADLNGNVSERVAGYRTVDGEIQIIPDNNAAMIDCDMSATSSVWKAIKPDGTLVTPGTTGTLHWNWLNDKITLDTVSVVEDVSRSTTFKSLAVNLTNVPNGAPEILKALALFPDDPDGEYGSDMFYMNTSGERLLHRGGSFTSGSLAGVFCGGGINTRSSANTYIGCRLAYYEP